MSCQGGRACPMAGENGRCFELPKVRIGPDGQSASCCEVKDLYCALEGLATVIGAGFDRDASGRAMGLQADDRWPLSQRFRAIQLRPSRRMAA